MSVSEREEIFFQKYKITLTYSGDTLTQITILDKDTNIKKIIDLTYTDDKLTEIDMKIENNA